MTECEEIGYEYSLENRVEIKVEIDNKISDIKKGVVSLLEDYVRNEEYPLVKDAYDNDIPQRDYGISYLPCYGDDKRTGVMVSAFENMPKTRHYKHGTTPYLKIQYQIQKDPDDGWAYAIKREDSIYYQLDKGGGGFDEGICDYSQFENDAAVIAGYKKKLNEFERQLTAFFAINGIKVLTNPEKIAKFNKDFEDYDRQKYSGL